MTGASRGSGETIARVFVANGMKVVLAARSEEQEQKVTKEIAVQGGGCILCSYRLQ